MILITTPTGHIGSQLLGMLLPTQEKLRVLIRDPSRLSLPAGERVEVIQGSMEDHSTLAKAFSGVDDLFLVIPPNNQCGDVYGYYADYGRRLVQVIKEEKVKRVVFISGTGLTVDGDAGGVTASVFVEKMLEASVSNLRILHCGTFMENLHHAAGSIKAAAQFGTTAKRDSKAPWVATKDIAKVAMQLLQDKSWKGVGSLGVLGPEDLSYGEIADIMGEVFGKKITYNEIAPELLISNVKKFGGSEGFGKSLVAIYSAMDRGAFNLVERTAETTTKTTVKEWLTEQRKVFDH